MRMSSPEVEVDLPTKVFQAIGAASVCWENFNKEGVQLNVGVFESDRAKQIADDLLTYINSNYIKIRNN